MREPIAGVTSSATDETTITTVWPSIALYPSGQWLGRLFVLRWPDIYIFRVGNLLALLAIPYALLLYLLRVAPHKGIRYRLTNRRVIVERGLRGELERAVALEDFEQIDIQVLDGQQWYHAGDLVFRSGQQEVFRLAGVSRPEPFRETCLQAHQARRLVAEVRRRQTETSAPA